MTASASLQDARYKIAARLFTNADNANAARVAVVNEAFVGLYLGKRPDPIGTPIQIEGKNWQISVLSTMFKNRTVGADNGGQ
jgi:hypothetical protein